MNCNDIAKTDKQFYLEIEKGELEVDVGGALNKQLPTIGFDKILWK